MAKRKADAVTFDDDDSDSGSGSDDDRNGGSNGGPADGSSGPVENDTKTPRAKGTPVKQKTPGSSPGMGLRSGRKKKRPKPNSSTAAAAGSAAAAAGVTDAGASNAKTGATPLKKRAKRTSDDDDDDEEYERGGTVVKQNGTKSGATATEEDESSENEDEDEDTTNAEEKKSEEKAPETGRKVPPEATREAVAAAQVTEGAEDTTAAAAASAAGNDGGNKNGSNGGILGFVSKLRLPSQHTPKPPARASAASASPAPPPGGRRLIFETARKTNDASGASAAAGGRNRFLMQTRGGAVEEEQRSTQREHFARPRTGAVAAGSAQEPAAEGAETSASFVDRLLEDREQMKSDLVLYAKAWFALLFACFLVGNAANAVSGGNLLGGSTWNVGERGAGWADYYGIAPAKVPVPPTTISLESDFGAEEEEEEVEIITKTVQVTDPSLLRAAKAKMRAHRANLHDVKKLEHNMKELNDGLDLLDGKLRGLAVEHPDFDFGRGKKKGKKKGKGGGEETLEQMVAREISSHDIVVFSKNKGCPRCKSTKKLLSSYEYDGEEPSVHVIELDDLERGDEIKRVLFDFTEQKGVPNVFVRGGHLGGPNEVQAAVEDGTLGELLEMPMYEPPEEESEDEDDADGEEEEEKEKKQAHEAIGKMRSGIEEKRKALEEWEWALREAEGALNALKEGAIGPEVMNEVIAELSSAAMVQSEAMVLDVGKISLPGEGCEGMDYVPLQREVEEAEEDEEEIEESYNEEEDFAEEDIVEVVGAIDVDALDVASDAPVRYEDAQTAYESLLKLAQSTSEMLVGAATKGPSSLARKWAEQIVYEELEERGVDEPPPIDEFHGPLLSEPLSLASSTSDGAYAAKDAVRDIDRMLEIEDADRTGKFDYASVVNGARVLRRGPYATSYSLYETLPFLNRVLAYTKLRFYGHPPEAALRPTFPMHSGGQCWSFADEFTSSRTRRGAIDMSNDGVGEYATLTVALASPITVTEVTIEHVPPALSEDPTTAISAFRVLGFEDSGAFGAPWELGTYRFVIGPSIQSFSIPSMLDGENVPRLKAVSIAVDSNWGAKYSCLYRVRVHGA